MNEEQIKKFSALYDNMVVLAGERTDIQAEAVPEATMSYFAIGCQISFRMTGEDQPTDTMKETFVNRVTEIFDSDEALSGYRVSELYFRSTMTVQKWSIALPTVPQRNPLQKHFRNSVYEGYKPSWKNMATK